MTKKESVKLLKFLKECYPAFFKTRKKEELVDFFNIFISEFEEFDYKLADHAINKLISERYKEKNRYCPNIIEMKNSVISEMVKLILEVLNKMKEEGYFKIGINGTDYQSELKAFYRYDNVLESLEKGHLTDYMRKEIEYRMNNVEEYKKYKGVLLLQYL